MVSRGRGCGWLASPGARRPRPGPATATPSAAGSVGGSRQAPRAFVTDEGGDSGLLAHRRGSGARRSRTGRRRRDTLPARLPRLSLDGRLALGERFELAAGVSLPPKRSEVTQVPTIVGDSLRGRLALGPRSSLYAQAFAERLLPLLAPRDDGAWSVGAVGLDVREYVDRQRRWLAFAGTVGASGGRALRAGAGESPGWWRRRRAGRCTSRRWTTTATTAWGWLRGSSSPTRRSRRPRLLDGQRSRAAAQTRAAPTSPSTPP